MVITVPINVDESAFEGAISRELEERLLKELTKLMERELGKRSRRSYSQDEFGLRDWMDDKITDYVEQFKDVIIETTSKMLAEKLARSKRGKEILEGIAE